MGFNFGQIGGALGRFFDSDTMDIKRFDQIFIDGRWREDYYLLYPKVPCHLTFNNTDNPDPATSDTQPINVSITIHCPIYVDLQNGDLITASKLDNAGNVLEAYTGLIGMPQTVQSRKRAIMEVRKG